MGGILGFGGHQAPVATNPPTCSRCTQAIADVGAVGVDGICPNCRKDQYVARANAMLLRAANNPGYFKSPLPTGPVMPCGLSHGDSLCGIPTDHRNYQGHPRCLAHNGRTEPQDLSGAPRGAPPVQSERARQEFPVGSKLACIACRREFLRADMVDGACKQCDADLAAAGLCYPGNVKGE